MKKFFCIMLLVLLCLFMYSCTYKDSDYYDDELYVIDTYLGGKYDFEQARKYALSAYSISIGYPSKEREL